MFAAPFRIAAFAALVATLPTPATASPYTDAVENAVFNVCPGLRSGQISAERPTTLNRLGYRRMREVEEDWSDAEDGAPFVFGRGSGAEAVTVGWWPGPRLCSVGFAGRQAPAAAAQLRARIIRGGRAYLALPSSDPTGDGGRREAWRVTGRAPLCLAIDTPGRQGEPLSYDVSYEPLPPLQPAITLSACAPPDPS